MEASKERRDKYLELIEDAEPSELVYIDESGIDMNICKDYEWGKKGKTIKAKKSGKYYERTNIIAGLVNNKPIVPFIFNGNCNTELFNKWISEFLLPELKPNQIVILDNAAFHKSNKTKELIESVNCKVIFLPPYSPDLNKIEKFWANMKRWIKHSIIYFDSLFSALSCFFNAPSSM